MAWPFGMPVIECNLVRALKYFIVLLFLILNFMPLFILFIE